MQDFVSFKKKAESSNIELHNIIQKLKTKVETNCVKTEHEYDTFEFELSDNTENESSNHIDISSSERNNIQSTSYVDYKCITCSKKFRTLSTFSRHLKNHNRFNNEAKTTTNVCDICYKTFKSETLLSTHLIKHHQDEKIKLENADENEKFKCEICLIDYQSMPSLIAHMKKHSTKKKELPCKICQKIFKKLSHLKRHELCHDQNKLHKCTECSKSFSAEYLLSDHLNEHRGLKPYICPICLKAFSQNSTLNSHIRIHSRKKTYLCPTCGKYFDNNSGLNQHMKRHAGDKAFACSQCPGTFVSKGL